ncbi:methyltransferase domain-containing protein [Caldimonas sp. KR1-144]|uniref:methyltransferase domain-containing protein n=1 Tax=Caldimonas sp. KR1-144 TaxID=3400911 RepID=UPI003C0C06F9
MTGPDRAFWQQRFVDQQTPWDRGAPSPQLAAWLADGTLAAGMRVAVPGCGAGHEVLALAAAGIDVVALDYAPAAVALVSRRLAQAGLQARVVEADVLAWQPEAPLDAIYEQTCLCALHPDHWSAYAAQLQRWLRPGGRLALLAMQAPRPGSRDGLIEGPPYHVDINALRALFPGAPWHWPKPPYARVDHPAQAHWAELALVLERR